MTLASGTKLGPYDILSPLGAGGMGEVYRARDTRLGRDVAIKILPESFARDADRLHRFQMEAQAVAALNHPNILAIYDVGDANGVPYLVSELLEGESLRAMLVSGPLPQRKVIEYGVQIAQGLAVAHEKGFVHRDLKPDNLFITRDGRAKILDFGLAKAIQKAAVASDVMTMTASPTAAGAVVGTASYMSPEQVRGADVDARTDIFALGAVLYEMLRGQRAFQRDTSAETMTAVLKEDVPELPGEQSQIAPALDRIVRRCLEKSPEQRFQSAKDLSFALAVLSGSDISSAARTSQAAKQSRRWLWVSGALAALLALAVTGYLSRSAPTAARMEFSIQVPGEVSQPALSVDGRWLAFVSPDETSGSAMLWVQQVGSPTATELTGTNGASYPFWSPDDNDVAFFANGKLQKIPARGGALQTLAKVTYARGGSWGSKNVILYAPAAGGPIWRVNADGSNAAPLTEKLLGNDADTAKSSHRWPLFLPDGEHFLFLRAEFGTDKDAQETIIYLTSLAAKEAKALVVTRSNPGYANGYLYYVDEKKALRAAPLNLSRGAISGESRVVADAIGFQPSVYWGAFTVGANQTVIYNESAAAAQSVLTWFDRTGKELGTVGEISVQANPSLSPSGDRVAVDITNFKETNLDVWVHDLKRGTSTRFTFDPSEDTDGVFSRDGNSIALRTNATGSSLLVKPATGLDAGKNIAAVGEHASSPLFEKAYDIIPNSWSIDDKELLCSLQSSPQGSQLVVVSVPEGKTRPFGGDRASETNGMISPDGKWAAYASNESGDWEIYVTTFPARAGKWQVSRGGGSEPRWRGDGKELYYLSSTAMLMSVAIEAGQTFSSGTPVALFQVRGRAPISSTDLVTYDVTKDGSRFLTNTYVKPTHIMPLTIVQNALSDPPKEK